MTAIPVLIEWSRDQAVFTDNRYLLRHRWVFDGGAEIKASSSPHIVPVPMSDAAAVDPEEAFVASLSSCHMLWFLSLAAKRGLRVNRYQDRAVGTLGSNGAGKLVMLRVSLRPEISWDGPAPAESIVAELHHEAHAECFLANSVRTVVVLEPAAQS